MSDHLTLDDIATLKKAAATAGISDPVVIMSRDAYIDVRMAHDPYGVYRNRKMMRKVLPKLVVYRGDEWWH